MLNTNISTNSIIQKANAPTAIQELIPDGSIYFEGVVSNGDKNRNGYTIDSDAWFFENGKYVDAFLKSGTVLYNHESDEPIGRPLTFKKVGDEVRVSGYVFDDTYTQGAVGRGLILGLSTGHITHEAMYERDGKRFTFEEYWDLPMSEVFSEGWEYIVTKAEICEFSFVTTPSNRSAVMTNSTEAKVAEYAKIKNLDPNEINTFLKNSSMKKQATTTVENEATETTTETTTETETVPAVEVEVIENGVAQVETNEVDTLKNKLAEMEANFETNLATKVAEAKAEIEANYAEKLAQETEAIRATERDSLAKVYGNGTASTVVKTAEDFKAKYSA